MSRHTPGPWTIDDRIGLPDDYYHEHTIYDQSGRLVASALSDADTSRDLNRSFANANLIAAAPVLLAELIAARDALREIAAMRGKIGPIATLAQQRAHMASAAIAKAGGA